VALLMPLLVHLGLLSDPTAGIDNPVHAPPSWSHWCGTDRLGRDVCSRTLAGSGVALQVVVLAVLIALLIGVPLGMVSGYLGGGLDRLLVLLMDTLYTLPVLLLSVVLAFLLGRGLPNAAAALCVVYIPQYFRVVRNQSVQIKGALAWGRAAVDPASVSAAQCDHLGAGAADSQRGRCGAGAGGAWLSGARSARVGSRVGRRPAAGADRSAHRHLVDRPVPRPRPVRAGVGVGVSG
jgi:hypothetical protein